MNKTALLITLLFILTACQSQLTPAPVDVFPTPSPTVTPTPNATERYQGTLQANQTQNAGYALTQGVRLTEGAQTRAVEALKPTLTPTIVPTSTPFPTFPLLPSDLIPPSSSSLQYKLASPDAPDLIKFSFLAMQQNQEYSSCSDGDADPCEIRWFRAFDARELEKVIDFEFDRFYPLGLSDFGGFVAFLNEQHHEDRWFLDWPETLSEEINKSVVHYLNDSHIILSAAQEIQTDYFQAKATQIEIDGDSEPEWLLKVVFPDYWNIAWLTLDQSEDQSYTPFALQFSNERNVGDFDKQAIVTDITGDGITDVVLVTDTYVGGGGNILNFNVRMGTPEGLKPISHLDVSFNSRTPFWISYEWIPASENSLPALKINYHVTWNWGCETDETEIYTWKNGKEKMVFNAMGEPSTVQCAIGRTTVFSDYATMKKPDNATAIRWLKLALRLNDESAELRPEELVYIYYRLGLLYALNGQDASARQYLELIQAVSLKGQAEIATYLWEAIEPLMIQTNISPYLLCKASIDVSLPIDNYGVWGDIAQYPYLGLLDGYPTPLCDMDSLQLDVLSQLTFSSTDSLETALQTAELPLVLVQPVPLQKQIPGWLVVVEEVDQGSKWDDTTFIPNGLIVYGYLRGYGWEEITTLSTKKDFRWINQDFTGDGFPELGLAVQAEINDCEVDTLAYNILVTSRIGGGVYDSERKTVCIHEMADFDWDTILVDKDKDGLSDFVVEAFFNSLDDRNLLNENPPDIPWILSWRQWQEISPLFSKRDILTSLDNQFFTSPSLLRPDLEFYRTRWGTGDDPASEQIYAHLTYLLALTYELEGDETQAVALYYDIWTNHPDTLWAYLAASRLELKP